jgi:hypothetical protein
MKEFTTLYAVIVACALTMGPSQAFGAAKPDTVVVGSACTELGMSKMTTDQSEIATCLYDNPDNNPPGMHWKIPGQKGVTAYEIFNACALGSSNDEDCFLIHDVPLNLFISPGGVQPSIVCGVLANDNQAHAVSVGVHTVDPISGAIGFVIEYSTILSNGGPAAPSQISCVYHHD